jgi:hypothetical protein
MVAILHRNRNYLKNMDAAGAQALIAGSKIKYWDGRIATVVVAYNASTDEVVIEFDADTQNPKPRHFIKSYDFLRAEPV